MSARAIASVARGLRNLVARAVVRRVDNAPKLQELQVEATAGELLDGCEHWHPYGFTAHPRPGAEALMLGIGGGRSRPAVVSVADRRYRLAALAEGEVAIHDDLGQCVVLTRTGIELRGNVRIVGTLSVSGAATLGGGGQVQGTLRASVDVIAGAGQISLVNHKTTDITRGSEQSGVPV